MLHFQLINLKPGLYFFRLKMCFRLRKHFHRNGEQSNDVCVCAIRGLYVDCAAGAETRMSVRLVAGGW